MESLTTTLTIATSQSASNAFELPASTRNVAFAIPAAWTAAGLAVQFAFTAAAPVAADWRTWTDQSAEVALPAAANRVLTPSQILLVPPGARWMRVISGTVGTPVVQTAQRDILAAVRYGRD